MATLARGARPARRARIVGKIGGPSVREVCLFSELGSASIRRPGDRIERGGRIYRVARSEVGCSEAEVHYLHLEVSNVERTGVSSSS